MAGLDVNAKLLLHFDGADEATTTVDSSASGHVLTPVANAQLDTAQKVFGSASSLFGGTPDYWTIPSHPDWDMVYKKATSMTLDFRVRFNTIATSQGMFEVYTSSANYWYLRWWTGGTFLLQMRVGGAINQIKINWSPAADTDYHIAIVRDGSTARYVFIDGVAQTLTVDTTNGSDQTLSDVLTIGNSNSTGFSMDGWLDEIRLSDVARWTANFTPPTEAYSVPPIVDTDIEIFNPQSPYTRDRFKKIRTNPGDFDVAGLNVPVPIKMDKWQNLSQPPARRKKVNPANTTQFVFVDFTVPVLPEVLINQWQNTQYPRKPKPPKVLPAAFATSEIAAINPINGNYFDTGVFGLKVTVVHAAEEQTYADIGVIGLTVTGIHAEDFQLEDAGTVNMALAFPNQGVEAFNSGVPGFVAANVIIGGLNESDFIRGIVSVTREDNTAARFNLFLEEDPDALLPRKPIEFINKIITINFAAADMDGVVSDYIPIFVGIIKGISFQEDQQTLRLSGYDYNGIHQTRGEYISKNITDILTGSIGAGDSGTLNTGHNPIWGVVWSGSNAVKDGTDYFVDTQKGQIVIPISSRILQYPGHFTYNYANHFGSMKDIIQAVAGQKNWVISEDAVTIADYTEVAAHPVLSLSDESVIDTCRKFLELSGAKLEGNLFPQLRVYSEVENWVNPVNTLVVDEDIIFEDTLSYNIDFENVLNEQTTRSVQRVSSSIDIGAGESIAEFSADAPSTNPFRVQTNIGFAWNLDLSTPTVLAEHRVAKQGLNSISIVSSGKFHLFHTFQSFEEPISSGSWNVSIDGDDFVIQLSHNVVVIGGGGVLLYAYPAFEYSLTVNGSKISYGGGSPEDVRVVTSQRPIGGVTDTLKGDVYENPYIETDTHCVNICNAVLLEHGNPYTCQFEMPVFEGKDAQIGNRVDIQRNSSTIFSGIIKRLNYQMDLNNGKNKIVVGAKGIGKGM